MEDEEELMAYPSAADSVDKTVRGLIEEAPFMLGMTMRDRRRQLGRSQQAIAAAMRSFGHSWHQTTVAKTEADARPITLTEALALTVILGLPNLEALYAPGGILTGFIDDAFWFSEKKRRDRSVADVRKQIADPALLELFEAEISKPDERAARAHARFRRDSVMRELLGLEPEGDEEGESDGEHPEAS